ncbi:MAG: 30S ribosomal protein S20 [Rhizobiales bacterium]|nr:30S ribosomal protein S20 [Hyphomicrobiales bacterium]
MANTSSAKKAIRKIARRTIVNGDRRTRMRTFIKRVETAIASGDRSGAMDALKVAEPEIMRAAGRGLLPKNTASRKVSRLSQRIRVMPA